MSDVRVRGLRGATVAASNTAQAIERATIDLVHELMRKNDLTPDKIVSAIITTTPDLTARFPASCARLAGWGDVPMLGAVEMAVPDSMPFCIRILAHVERSVDAPELEHVYLGRAQEIRPRS